MKVKHQTEKTRFWQSRQFLTKHKDRIEAAAVLVPVCTAEYFTGMLIEDPKIGIPAAMGLYAIAGSYSKILKKLGIRKEKEDERTSLFRRMLITGELLAGMPAIPAFYLTMRYISDEGIIHPVLSISLAWLAARAVGFIAWGGLNYLLERERYTKTGIGNASELLRDAWNGFIKNFSPVKQGAYNETAELFGYTRRLDRYAVLARPLSMLTILALGYEGKAVFEIYGLYTVPLITAYYAIYFGPKFYPDAGRILEAKTES